MIDLTLDSATTANVVTIFGIRPSIALIVLVFILCSAIITIVISKSGIIQKTMDFILAVMQNNLHSKETLDIIREVRTEQSNIHKRVENLETLVNDRVCDNAPICVARAVGE